MGNFLDEYPQDWTNPGFKILIDNLIIVYPDPVTAKQMAVSAGIASGSLPTSYQNMIGFWTECTKTLGRQGKLRTLVTLAARDETVSVDLRTRFAELLDLPPSSIQSGSVDTEETHAERDYSTMPDKRALRQAMMSVFSLEDLKILCADVQQLLADDGIDLQVDLDIVGGDSKAVRILNLITYLDNRGYLSYLVIAAHGQRPSLAV